MSKRRDIRRLAMQVLYQLDVTGMEPERASVLSDLDDEFDPPEVREPAVDLALAAWADHDVADRMVSALTPDWPTYRQPPVDRALLRLAYHEMTSGYAPVKVAINEHVELAKRFAGQGSPAFVNGVLDKLARQLRQEGRLPETGDQAPTEPDTDAWLRDARDTP